MTFTLRFEPADTFIVRDGRPFNQDDAGMALANSLFPPPPFTMHGAARVALARAFGWSGAGDWSESANYATGSREADKQAAERCIAAIGAWNESPDGFVISGPFIRRETFGGSAGYYLPSPANLRALREDAASNGFRELRAIGPCEPALDSDIGDNVRFLDPARGQGGEVARTWISMETLERYLQNAGTFVDRVSAREHILAESDIVVDEVRTGLAIAAGTRLAEHGQLYATGRRRLREGFSFAAEIWGIDVPLQALPPFVPFGGESRFCFIDAHAGVVVRQPNLDLSAGRYAIVLLTPAIMAPPRPGGTIEGCPGKIVSAAIDRVVLAGTFLDRRDSNQRGPQASGAVVPGGTVIYLECGHAERPPSTSADLAAIGEKTHLGFGRYLIGAW